jgi:hypothetical protein
MSDDEQRQALKTIVGEILPPDQTDRFVEVALLKAFTDEAGEIDKDKVMGHLTAIYAAGQPNWGQHSGNPPGEKPGAAARSALERRHGVKSPDTTPAAGAQLERGAGARAALAKRHGRKTK